MAGTWPRSKEVIARARSAAAALDGANPGDPAVSFELASVPKSDKLMAASRGSSFPHAPAVFLAQTDHQAKRNRVCAKGTTLRGWILRRRRA